MCTSPIHIKAMASPRFEMEKDGSISQSASPFFGYDVPCGKCPECKQSKIDSYFLRCYTEFTNCGYNAVFSTLTYDNEHLPYITNAIEPVFDDDGVLVQHAKTLNISCWNKSHIQKFLKQLNEKIIYYIGTEVLHFTRLETINGRRRLTDTWKKYLSTFERPLKYICVCERGKSDMYISDNGMVRFGTARPHYHLIIFLNTKFICCNQLRRFIAETWQYGHTYDIQIGENSQVHDRDLSQSIGYVVKYVTKDLQDDTYKCYYRNHEEELQCKPFVLLSNFLGSTLLDNYSSADIIRKMDTGISVNTHNGTRQINIPRYNLSRLTSYEFASEKVISKRTPQDYFDFSVYPPIYITHCSSDLEDVKQVKRYRCLTQLGIELEKNNLNSKATYYSDLLLELQGNSSIFDIYKSYKCSNLSNHDKSLINDFSADDMYLFILNDLYIVDNHALHPTPIYHLYLLLREYSCTLSRIRTLERKVVYESNIEKAMNIKPELFKRNPINN